MKARPLAERWKEKVLVTPTCWLWQGCTLRSGYGRIGIGNGKTDGAHRVAYELFKGPIPDGFVIDHLCKVTRCVNPEHLEAVTTSVNTMRAHGTDTHCKNGHPRTPENTYVETVIHRHCRPCQTAREAARYQIRVVGE